MLKLEHLRVCVLLKQSQCMTLNAVWPLEASWIMVWYPWGCTCAQMCHMLCIEQYRHHTRL